MDIRNQPLLPSRYFHIFNRGTNGRKVFFERENYFYFLRQYSKYVTPYVYTYAYCLLPNHFHLLVRIKDEDAIVQLKECPRPMYWYVSNAFSSWIKSYTQAVNKRYAATGPLFERPFKRIEIDSDEYLTAVIAYIHQNPLKHHLYPEFENYSFSSYRSILEQCKRSSLERETVLNWFGGRDSFIAFHKTNATAQSDLFLE